jgi:prophage regulatory protein
MNQLLNIKQVVLFVGVCRSTIYEMMDENSPYYDPTFPKKVKITQNRIGWSAWEINQWIEDKLASRE